MLPNIQTLGTLTGLGSGLLGNTLKPQNWASDAANYITNKATSQSEIDNANLTADGLKKSLVKSQQSQAIADINSAKKNAEAIQY